MWQLLHHRFVASLMKIKIMVRGDTNHGVEEINCNPSSFRQAQCDTTIASSKTMVREDTNHGIDEINL